MKIIYLTDIHDGLKGLKYIFQNTEADMYLLSGDIIYKAFFSFDRIIDFCSYQKDLDEMAKQDGGDMTPYDFATRVIRFPQRYGEDIQQKCTNYRALFSLAAKTMKEKYDLINQLVAKYAKSDCYFLPGNYDIDLQYTHLFEMDIHRKSFKKSGLKFSGYGGAPIVTSGIPEKLAVKFHEYSKNGFTYSEPEDFFKEELPDVAIIHNPAYGYLDKIPGYGNIGSQGIRRYIDEYPPILVVSGHVHEDQGVVRKGRTLFLNPSNFGPVDSVYGFQEGGFLGEILIDLDQKIVSQVSLWKLKNSQLEEWIRVNTKEQILKPEFVHPHCNIPVEDFVRN
jgi:Icc-related predicted phosphoesterase